MNSAAAGAGSRRACDASRTIRAAIRVPRNDELQRILVDIVEDDRFDRLARRGDLLRDGIRRRPVSADDEHGRDVRVATQPDQLPRVIGAVGAELAAAVGRRDRQRSGDAARDTRRGGADQPVDREHQHMIARPDAAVGRW